MQRYRKAERKSNGQGAGHAARIRSPEALEIPDIERSAESGSLESVCGASNAKGHIGTQVENGREAEKTAHDKVAVRIGAHAVFEGHGAARRELLGAFFEEKRTAAGVSPGRSIGECGRRKGEDGASDADSDEVC